MGGTLRRWDKTIFARVSDAQYEALQEAADADQTNVSCILRQLVEMWRLAREEADEA